MPAARALRILVAEDNSVNQAVIRGMLEYAGHQVETVLNGKVAIEELENSCFDFVIMDCLMPVMDGFEATRRIRGASGEDFDPNIPVLAITALSSPEDRLKCADAGMSGFISKPVIAKDLFAWLEMHFDTAPSTDRQANRRQTAAEASLQRRGFAQEIVPGTGARCRTVAV